MLRETIMSGLPPKPDFAYLPPQNLRHEQRPRPSDSYTRFRRDNSHSSRPPDAGTYTPRDLSRHRDPPRDDVYIPRPDSSRWKGPPRDWETRDDHVHRRRAIPRDHSERRGSYTPRHEPSWRNGLPRDRRFRDEDRTYLVTGPSQESCYSPQPCHDQQDRRSRSPPHHRIDERRSLSSPSHDARSPCQLSCHQSRHERLCRRGIPSSAQEDRAAALLRSPRHHLYADTSGGSPPQNRNIESGEVRSTMEHAPSQDQLPADTTLRAPIPLKSPPMHDKGKEREEIVGDIDVSVEARPSYFGTVHTSTAPHNPTEFNASTASNHPQLFRFETQQAKKMGPQIWDVKVQETNVDSSQIFVPIPPYQPRVPEATPLNDPKLAEISTLQNRRVSLLVNYSQLIKAVHRAQYDRDMGLLDVQTVEQRRLIADEQEQLAKDGTLGIDFLFTQE